MELMQRDVDLMPSQARSLASDMYKKLRPDQHFAHVTECHRIFGAALVQESAPRAHITKSDERWLAECPRPLDEEMWAEISYNMAINLSVGTSDDRVQLNAGIRHALSALEVKKKEDDEDRWALLHQLLGKMYGGLAKHTKAESDTPAAEMRTLAISHLRKALTVYTRAYDPAAYGETVMFLGNAYSDKFIASGDTADGKTGLEYLKAALSVKANGSHRPALQATLDALRSRLVEAGVEDGADGTDSEWETDDEDVAGGPHAGWKSRGIRDDDLIELSRGEMLRFINSGKPGNPAGDEEDVPHDGSHNCHSHGHGHGHSHGHPGDYCDEHARMMRTAYSDEKPSLEDLKASVYAFAELCGVRHS